MTRPNLTDALIREALTPEPGLTAPAGLLASISSEVARNPQQRPPLRLPGPANVHPVSRRLTWMAITAAAVLGLVAGLLLGGGGPPRLQSQEVQPSPLPQELAAGIGMGAGTHILAVSADEAWVARNLSDNGGDLWHRTTAGWAGPIDVGRIGFIRGLSRMPDGRILVAADDGVWAGNDDGWTQISHSLAWNAVADGTGTIWTTGAWGANGSVVQSLRETGGAWQAEWTSCSKGGSWLATAQEGVLWTAGIGYSDPAGIARLQDGACTEIFPLDDAISHNVSSLTADGTGRVAAAVLDPMVGDTTLGGQIMAWDGTDWTVIRRGAEVVRTWEGLSYGPDGTLWAKIGGELWRYSGGVWSLERSGLTIGPVSVAPDGTVWFMGRDMIEHLHPDAAMNGTQPAAATPAPPLADLPTHGWTAGVHILAVGADEAWAALASNTWTPGLWHRTAVGWRRSDGIGEAVTYPPELQPAGLGVTAPTGTIWDLARLPDGRIVIGADTGVWVGGDDGWNQVAPTPADGVAVDQQGTIWAATRDGPGSVLRSYREVSGSWQEAKSTCPAGGMAVAIASDGSAWTVDAGYFPWGIARLQAGSCSEVFPLGDATRYAVSAIAAGGEGRVAAVVLDPMVGGAVSGAKIVAWDGTDWTVLRSGAEITPTLKGIAYAPDGTLWATINSRLWRYADGVWSQERSVQTGSPVSVAPDGTVWFIGANAIEHLHPDAGSAPSGG